MNLDEFELTLRSFQATSGIKLLRYQREDGSEPFTDWLVRLRDKEAAARIRLRLRQVEAGNFGDGKPVGEGVTEMPIHADPGYRVYYGRHGDTIVILLCGGDKKTRPSDIERARELWLEWKARQS